MNTFTKRMMWLFGLMILTVSVAFAQPGAQDVEPGTKGALPSVPSVAPAQDGLVNCLELVSVGMDYIIINGYRTVRANISWDQNGLDGLKRYGASSCTVQYREHGTDKWEKYEDFNAESETGGTITGCSPGLQYSLTDYRIVLHGGDKDGWVSNVVTAKSPSMYSRYKSWGDDNNQMYNLVGMEIGTNFGVTVETLPLDSETDEYVTYSTEDGYYTYQWYRRNPNTWEMKAIEGATNRTYTAALADAGYELILDVGGDGQHCSFTLRRNFGKVYQGVFGSIEQFLEDGFILNTDYVLPDPKNNLIKVKAGSWGENHKDGTTMDTKERKPGQYAVKMDVEDYKGCMIDIAGDGYMLIFIYTAGWMGDQPWYREAQLLVDRYIGQFNVKAQLNGEDVLETTIDVLTKNIDGKETVVASKSFAELGRDMVSFNLYKGTYYLKARKTDKAMETYYPSTLLWSEAEPISPQIGSSQQGQPGGKDSDEGDVSGGDQSGQAESGEGQSGQQEEGATEIPGQEGGVASATRGYEVEIDEGGGSSIPTFTIAMLAVPAPLTGTGVIEGTVVLNEKSTTRGGDEEVETCRVYLKAKEAEVVAQTETDANGKFRFENVPFGDYQVLLDVEGRTMKSVQEVVLTEEKPEVAELDYVVTGTEIVTKEEYVAATTESIQISSAKQLAYCSDQDLDFSTIDALKAYVATGYDNSTGTIWLTRVKEVPANTGFLIMGEAGEYPVPVKSGGSNAYYKNMFKGTLEAMTLPMTEEIDGKEYANYYLSKGDYGVGFYKVTKAEGQSLQANRAYLPIPTEIPAVGTAGGTESIKVSAAGQVPYYSANSLDFTDMPDVKAYTATGYDYKSGTIWLTRVKKVPALTGILIMADAGDYPIPTASVASIYENMFKGSLTATKIYPTENIAGVDYINYYLSSGDYGVGFYKVTKADGQNLGANRCYLPIPQKSAAGTRSIDDDSTNISIQESDEVIGLRVFGSAEGTSNIETNNREPITNNLWYNLQGQRVEKPTKGLYIKNGKKVVIK